MTSERAIRPAALAQRDSSQRIQLKLARAQNIDDDRIVLRQMDHNGRTNHKQPILQTLYIDSGTRMCGLNFGLAQL
jgi:hypothetical protein